jgi:electron transfer flavoprotein beta subunit
MSMERQVVVCVKPARSITAGPSVGPRPAQRARAALRPVKNEADFFALEEALRARDRGEVGRVVCVSAGPPRAREALVAALEMGADHAIRIDVSDDSGLDTTAAAALLAAAIRSFGGRLVFAAQMSDHGGSGLVPPFLARRLDAVYLSNVMTFRLTDGEVEIQRRVERGGRQAWRAPLPAVVAFDGGINIPRYPRVAARLRARRQTIEETSPAVLGVDLRSLPHVLDVLRLEPLRRRPKKIALPTREASAADRMRALVGGGIAAKANKVVAGPVDQLVATTVAFLKERRLLDYGRDSLVRHPSAPDTPMALHLPAGGRDDGEHPSPHASSVLGSR